MLVRLEPRDTAAHDGNCETDRDSRMAANDVCSICAARLTAGSRALEEACLRGDLKMLRTLLVHGATFGRCGPAWYPFGAKWLFRSTGVQDMPERILLEVVRLLTRYGELDPAQILLPAIFAKRFEIADALLRGGTVLSGQERAMLSGSIQPGSQFCAERIQAMQGADDTELQQMIVLIRGCIGGRRAAVDADGVLANRTELLPRFREPHMLEFMLKNTRLRKDVSARVLVWSVVKYGVTEGLEVMVRHGLLDTPSDMELLLELLREIPGQHPELRAAALVHIRRAAQR